MNNKTANGQVVVLNVKLPFCEAVELLRDEVNYVGVTNPQTGVVMYVDKDELYIKKEGKGVNLTVTDILDADWYIMCRESRPNSAKEGVVVR